METKNSFEGRLIILGFGSIASGLLPLLRRHIDIPPERIRIIAPHMTSSARMGTEGVEYVCATLTRENYRDILAAQVAPGDFVINLTVEVASLAVMEFCAGQYALYIDASIEPWAGGYVDSTHDLSARTNGALRQEALDLRARLRSAHDVPLPTAILAHGANPGLVSHFIKRALIMIAKETTGRDIVAPTTQREWAMLAQNLGVKTIHIAERDTQVPVTPRESGEFMNTWSVNGFIGESLQPAEFGFGTHEKTLPENGCRQEGGSSAIYLEQPGVATMVRSWVPSVGPQYGFLITHDEAISIADYLSILDAEENIVYRPTVHYAYHPCDAAILSLLELRVRNGMSQERQHVLTVDEITSGNDELGVLVFGNFGVDAAGKPRRAYWHGSVLSTAEARELVPWGGATTLQVTAGMLGAIIYALQNPSLGIISADDIPYQEVLRVADPYLGKLLGVFTDWTPLMGREHPLYVEDVDTSDPFQFKNFLL